MTTARRIVYGAALLLAIVAVAAATSQPQTTPIRKVSLSDLEVEITTTKTTYRVGEAIMGIIWLVNNSPEPVSLTRTFTAYVTAGYPPDLHSAVVNIDYASPDAETEIPSGGRVGLIPFSYSTGKAGAFEVRAYGATATIEVTGLKYEPLTPQPTIPIAYSTNAVYNIQGVNLAQVIQLAQAQGFNVMSEDYIYEWGPGNGTIHVSASLQLPKSSQRGILLDYDRYANITHVRFSLPADPWEKFDLLWDNFGRYMHEDVAQLNATVWDVERGYYWMSFTALGEPDWDIVRADAGSLVERHTRWVGRIFEYYDSDSFINTMTSYTIVELERTMRVGSIDLRVVLRLSIDDNGDFSLNVYESAPVRFDDPATLFAPMFDSLGLSKVSLIEVKLDPSWWIEHNGYYP